MTAGGRRISKAITGTGSLDCTYQYYYDQDSLAETRNGSDIAIKQQVWGRQYVDELVQVGVNSDQSGDNSCDAMYWVCQDANYNVLGLVGLLDNQWVLAERYEYTPYGQRTVFFSPGVNDVGCYASTLTSRKIVVGGVAQPYGLCEFGHQGLQHDEEGGLIYNRARMLQPVLGRFLQRDPLGYVDGENIYEYERSNALIAVDTFGLSCNSVDRTSYLNIPSATWARFALGPIPFIVKGKVNVTYGIQMKTCDTCCPNGLNGKITETQIKINATAFVSLTAGIDEQYEWGGNQLKVWGGVQGTGGTEVSGTASFTKTTCSATGGSYDVCLNVTPQIALRVGGEARLQTAWWSWTVGLNGYGQAKSKGKMCWKCDDSGCSYKGITFDHWTASLGLRACFGVCYTIGEFDVF